MDREEMTGVSPRAFQHLQDRMAEGSSKAAKKEKPMRVEEYQGSTMSQEANE